MIRLQRIGKPKAPTFRFVVSDKRKDTQGASIEILGHCNLQTNPPKVEVKKERAQYWISKGAQCSDTVHNIFVNAGVVTGAKKRVSTITKKRAAKITAKNSAKGV